jgi:hypothetical protein
LREPSHVLPARHAGPALAKKSAWISPHLKETDMSQYLDCMAALDRCAAACQHCASSCIAEGNLPDMEKCIRLDLDCAALCRFTSEALARDSQFMRDFCDLCARICDACADECGRHPADHCQECSDACRACAEACRAL